MSYPVEALVTRVRRILEDTPYESRNSSDPGEATAGDLDTFNVVDGTKWAEGDVLEFQDQGELCYVVSVAGNALTVIRGYDGSVTAAHEVDTRVYKNTNFAWQTIQENIVQTINGLWPNVWKKLELEIVPDADTKWYNLTDEWVLLSQVVQIYGEGQDLGYFGADGGRPCLIRRNLPAALADSGTGLFLPQGFYHESNSIFATGIGRILPGISGDFFNDVEDTGLAVETVSYGAAAKVILTKEVVRVSGEDVSQSDQSVPPLRRAQVAAVLEQKYFQLLNDWNAYLMETTPPMARWY